MKVTLLTVATGPYFNFVQPLIESAAKYFLPGHQVNYVVFSDKHFTPATQAMVNAYFPNITFVKVPHTPFPMASMDRYKHYVNYMADLKEDQRPDYIFAIDSDSLFVDDVCDWVLAPITAVRHSAYYTKQLSDFPYETDPKSACAMDCNALGRPAVGEYYYGGGFIGGNFGLFETICKFIAKACTHDVMIGLHTVNGPGPLWHDESALNKILWIMRKNGYKINALSPEHHYPQWHQGGALPHVQVMWDEAGLKFTPRILLIDKARGDNENLKKYRTQ